MEFSLGLTRTKAQCRLRRDRSHVCGWWSPLASWNLPAEFRWV